MNSKLTYIPHRLGIILFSVKISLLNGVGMLIAVIGAAYYSKVELDRKRAAPS